MWSISEKSHNLHVKEQHMEFYLCLLSSVSVLSGILVKTCWKMEARFLESTSDSEKSTCQQANPVKGNPKFYYTVTQIILL